MSAFDPSLYLQAFTLKFAPEGMGGAVSPLPQFLESYSQNLILDRTSRSSHLIVNERSVSAIAVMRDGVLLGQWLQKMMGKDSRTWEPWTAFYDWDALRRIKFSLRRDGFAKGDAEVDLYGPADSHLAQITLNFVPEEFHRFRVVWEEKTRAGLIPQALDVEFVEIWEKENEENKVASSKGESWFGGLLKIIGGIVVLIFLIGFLRGIFSGPSPSCQMVNVTIQEHVFTDKGGNPDYGFIVSGTVLNKGGTGEITANAQVTSSEGDWAKTQTNRFADNQQLRIDFEFPEPTINVKNVRYGVTCSP